MSANYVIIQRDTAVRSARVLRWVAQLLQGAGPSWHRHADDMRLAAADLESAVEMTDARADKARRIA